MLATVDERFGGSVHMKRLHAPEGFELDLMVSDEDFTKLMPVTGKDEELVVEDMVLLHDVNEAGMLHNLRQRYLRDDIYTSIGPILIAINPYKSLDMCGAEAIAHMIEVGHAHAHARTQHTRMDTQHTRARILSHTDAQTDVRRHLRRPRSRTTFHRTSSRSARRRTSA